MGAMGEFWTQGHFRKLQRVVFLGFIQAAALRALTAFVVPRHATDTLDVRLSRKLRCLIRGKAHWVDADGAHGAFTNQHFLKRPRLPQQR